MPGAANGLSRDLNLIRRRWWVFLPFLALGALVSTALGQVAGDANATATMQLETVVNDATLGGDRGLRIFEAQSMTSDDIFKEKVIAKIGEPNFNYGRFDISLRPISVADGVSRGDLTVSIKDPSRERAEELRKIWVDIFLEEYTEPTGHYRARFLKNKEDVAALAQVQYIQAYAPLKAKLEGRGLPADEVIRGQGTVDSLTGQISMEVARLQSQLEQVNAAIAVGPTGAQATVVLGVPVSDAAAEGELRKRQDVLQRSVKALEARRLALSDVAFDRELLAEIDSVRSTGIMRNDAYLRLNNARIAVQSAQSSAETRYATSGGVAGSIGGRIGVTIVVAAVFGLIAIYLMEWLSQVRSGIRTPGPADEDL